MKKVRLLCSLLFFTAIFFAGNEIMAQYEDASSENRMFYYSGYFGPSEKIDFNLQINSNSVSGSYIVEKTGALYTFSGRLASDKSAVGLIIFNEDNQFVATIEAKFITESNNFGKEIKGKWKSSDGGKIVNVSLKKVAEIASADQPKMPAMKSDDEKFALDYDPALDPEKIAKTLICIKRMNGWSSSCKTKDAEKDNN